MDHLLLPSYRILARPSWAQKHELAAPGALPQVDLARLLLIASKYDRRARFDEFKVTKALEASFLNEAEIVFTTLNSSGRQVSRERDSHRQFAHTGSVCRTQTRRFQVLTVGQMQPTGGVRYSRS